VRQIKQRNEVFEIDDADGSPCFLKYYTKGWTGYGAATWVSVHREARAWELMRGLGLGSPEVLAADETIDNPLEQPHLITRRLPGRPLFDSLGTRDQPGPHDATIVREVGRFVGRMHAQRFPHTGPLSPGYLEKPVAADDYHFVSWSRQGMEAWWQGTRADDADHLESATAAARETFVAEHLPRAVAAMADPRFVHGDCHAHQFFCDPDDAHRITGVIDLECAQSSERGPDFLKLFIELTGHFAPRTDWIDPFWDGYGEVYDFDLLRLYLLIFQQVNFKCYPPSRAWPGDREKIVRHLLTARDYHTLARDFPQALLDHSTATVTPYRVGRTTPPASVT